MEPVTLCPVFQDQAFYPDGRPLNGGLLTIYTDGDLVNTWTSSDGDILNLNPIVLMSDGTLPPGVQVYLIAGEYELTRSTPTGEVLETQTVSIS